MLHAFYQNTRNTLNITCLQLNHPLVSKRSTGCTRQDLESCCLLPTCYVLTKSLTVPVAACVKDGSYSSSSLSESQWTVLMGYLTISTNVRAINHITDDNRYLLSPVRLSSVCPLSVTLVRPTPAVQIFGNISTALGTLATSYLRWHIKACWLPTLSVTFLAKKYQNLFMCVNIIASHRWEVFWDTVYIMYGSDNDKSCQLLSKHDSNY